MRTEIIKIPVAEVESFRRRRTHWKKLCLLLGFGLPLLALVWLPRLNATGEGSSDFYESGNYRGISPSTHSFAHLPPLLRESAELREQASLLAGMRFAAHTASNGLLQNKRWQAYATRLEQRWQALQTSRWQVVNHWAASELKIASPEKTALFYPFGGPDFLYASLLFPDAPEYYLIGLEPIGELPQLERFDSGEQAQYLSALESSLGALMNFGFFKTNDMRQDFNGRRLNGILPLLLVLLTRTAHQVVDINLLQSDAEGKWHVNDYPLATKQEPVPRAVASPTTVAHAVKSGHNNTLGVMIRFRKAPNSALQTLYYFSINLENSQLDANRQFTAFIKSRTHVTTLIKSASYLMHSPAFSSIRELILNQSAFIVQDDSGIPLKYFDETQWSLNFYGVYDGPISLFKGKYQADLKRRYNQPGNGQQLPFGIGYKWQPGTANLLVARRTE